MYNGIGLQTPRGSGTNGYVSMNKFNLRAHPTRTDDYRDKDKEIRLQGEAMTRTANKELVERAKKREIEVKVFVMREQLEELGTPEEDIERQLATYRERLEKERKAEPERAANETHAIAARKEAEMSQMKAAFGLDSGHSEGRAFDRELQERQRMERLQQREEEERRKLKAVRDSEKAKKRAIKEERKKRKEGEGGSQEEGEGGKAARGGTPRGGKAGEEAGRQGVRAQAEGSQGKGREEEEI
mmetsp:Transcript_4466/g.16002  ORF Transcript_4466/g.16002 Transcript_4466/m.16002 type:complete len:243 (+) Transcript_4466:119-847(+)